MARQVVDCIKEYIKEKYTGRLIGISDLANFCHQQKWDIYQAMEVLKDQGKVEIITRYFCPETHSIPGKEYPSCTRCGLKYSTADIVVAVYMNPVQPEEFTHSS